MFRIFAAALTLCAIGLLPARGADLPDHALQNDFILSQQASAQVEESGVLSLESRVADLEAALARSKPAIAQAEARGEPFLNPYPSIAILLTRYYESANNKAEWQRVFDISLRLHPKSTGNAAQNLFIERTDRAEMFSDLGRYREAVPAFAASLATPGLPPVFRAALLRGYGDALLHLDRMRDAEVAYKESLKLDPTNTQAQGQLETIRHLRRGGKKFSEISSVVAIQLAPPPPQPGPASQTPAKAVGRTHDCASYYPKASGDAGELGGVYVSYDVDARGGISNVALVKTSGYPRLDDAALACVREQWRDTPAMEGDTPVASPGHKAVVVFDRR